VASCAITQVLPKIQRPLMASCLKFMLAAYFVEGFDEGDDKSNANHSQYEGGHVL
jgi:hypothetical protein